MLGYFGVSFTTHQTLTWTTRGTWVSNSLIRSDKDVTIPAQDRHSRMLKGQHKCSLGRPEKVTNPATSKSRSNARCCPFRWLPLWQQTTSCFWVTWVVFAVNMALYIEPPTGRISWQKLETFAQKRLDFLMKITEARGDLCRLHELVCEEGTVTDSECLIVGSVKDKVSHFMLRWDLIFWWTL